jgi:mRNA-degrading endonuclease YafQ of YafQ-DinJ toxin-antitoxin module
MYRFRAAEGFWKKFYRLSPGQKESVRRAWSIFKTDPFDSRLGTHKINNLSAQYHKTVYSVVIEADLRAVFYVDGDTLWTVDIGSHSIYR